MAKKREFTFEDGQVVEFKEVPMLALERLVSGTSGKPKKPPIPMVQFEVDGERVLDPNPDDPDYNAALTQWEQDIKLWESNQNLKTLQFLIKRAVISRPPAEYLEENASFLEGMKLAEKTYFWIVDCYEAEIAALSEAIIGQTEATEVGVQEAEEAFHAASERTLASQTIQLQDQK